MNFVYVEEVEINITWLFCIFILCLWDLSFKLKLTDAHHRGLKVLLV